MHTAKLLRDYLQILLLFIFPAILSAQVTSINVSGTIIDSGNGETLIGATVYEAVSQSGTSTNEYGFYSLTIPTGVDSVSIDFSYVGFQSISRKIFT